MKYTFNGKVYGLNIVTIDATTESTEQDAIGIRYHDAVTFASDAGTLKTEYHHGATWDSDESNGDFLTEEGWENSQHCAEMSAVLSSIASDATAGGYDFPDFYETFGYSNVPEAWKAWKGCKKVRSGFKRVFGAGVDSDSAKAFLDAVYKFDNCETEALQGIFPID